MKVIQLTRPGLDLKNNRVSDNPLGILVKFSGMIYMAMINYWHILAAVISIILLQSVDLSMAEEKDTIITAGPSWDRFTNKDGHGLYHDIIKEVFADYTVRHIYVPTVQANSMVAIGRADIKMCETKEIDNLLLARQPMYENDFYAIYLRTRINRWNGDVSLKGKKVVWREGYYSQLDFPVPVDFTEVRSGESALKMIVYERADVYIDDLNLIKQTFDNAGEELDPGKFGLEKVGTRKYFPVFSNSPRGETLRKHYEQEIERLYRKGTLQQIYKHWGFRTPDFKFSLAGK